MKVPVLMYHAIGDSGTGTQEYDDTDFTVSETKFRSHLSYLKKNDFTSILPGDLASQQLKSNTPEKHCIITFDDGHCSDVQVALPILKEYGFNAVFFITTEWVGEPGYMNHDELRQLSEAGMELGSHGHTHAFFNDMTFQQANWELQQSCSILQEISGEAVRSFSAPGGQMPSQLRGLIEAAQVKYVCTSLAGVCRAENFPLAIPRCAIRQSLCDEDFVRMVNGDASFYRRMKLRAGVLGAVRKVLGNSRYMALREVLN